MESEVFSAVSKAVNDKLKDCSFQDYAEVQTVLF